MKRLLVALALTTLGLGFFIDDADAARRFGGGRSLGSQREGVTQRQATPPAAAPSQSQAAPNAVPAQRPGMGRWMGPLAGLAAGLGLAALFGSNMGGLLAGLLVVMAVVIGAALLMRLFGRNRTQPLARTGAPVWATPTPSGSDPATLRTARDDLSRRQAAVAVAAFPGSPATADSSSRLSQNAASVPAGFDTEAFLQHAKKSFIELQNANDRGDLTQIRDMSTPEMYDALKTELQANRPSAGGTQQVDVVTLNAELLEVVTEGAMHWASIRFSGALRESSSEAPAAFTEIWNLRKPVNGDTGWLLAGIQQVA